MRCLGMSKRPVGRPPKTDPSGDRIELKTINITVPRHLWLFLKENNIKRSELFVEVVTMLKSGEICPWCYRTDRSENEIGVYCPHCSGRGRGLKRQEASSHMRYIYIFDCPKCGNPFKKNEHGKFEVCCK